MLIHDMGSYFKSLRYKKNKEIQAYESRLSNKDVRQSTFFYFALHHQAEDTHKRL